MSDDPNDMQAIRIIETPYDLENKNIICYPNLIVQFRISVARIFMKPRIVYSTITVDLVKGQAARSNMFPNSEEIQISNSAVITRLVNNDEPIHNAEQLVLKWLRHKFKIYKEPGLEVIRQEEVFKAFFQIQDDKNKTIVVDSVRGVEA